MGPTNFGGREFHRNCIITSARLRLPRLRHQRHPLGHSLETANHDQFSGFNPARDLDDSLRPRTEYNYPPARFSLVHDPHDVRRPERLHRIFWNDDRAPASRCRKSRLDEHARPQNAARIWRKSLHHDGAVLLLHDRIDEINLRSECSTRLGRNIELDCLAELET